MGNQQPPFIAVVADNLSRSSRSNNLAQLLLYIVNVLESKINRSAGAGSYVFKKSAHRTFWQVCHIFDILILLKP